MSRVQWSMGMPYSLCHTPHICTHWRALCELNGPINNGMLIIYTTPFMWELIMLVSLVFPAWFLSASLQGMYRRAGNFQGIYSASYLVVPTFDILTCDDVLLPRAGSTGAIKF